MAKPNYAFEKRQRELAKKQKKQAKQQRKLGVPEQPSPNQPGAPENPSVGDKPTP